MEKEARSRLERRILEEAPRLTRTDSFRFSCHPGVRCFGDCCGDVNIVLTPYDVLRLKNRLGLTSDEFLDRYAVVPFTKEQKLPAPLIRMREDEKKRCPFLDDGGCSVYEDRPWACRMYPLGFASPAAGSSEEEFYFLLEEEGCLGFSEEKTQTVDEWLVEQGIPAWDEMGSLYKKLAFDDAFAAGKDLSPKGIEMYWMALYDLDRFRRFVFESTFLSRFDVPESLTESIREDDTELLRFAFRWLEFALFGRPTMTFAEHES